MPAISVGGSSSYQGPFLRIVQSRADLFPESVRQHHYSLERYHIMGSLILSRSFHVELWAGDEGQAGVAEEHNETTDARGTEEGADAMDVDSVPQETEDKNPADETEPTENILDAISDGEDDEDAESPADVAMVPIADMLNARYGSENVNCKSHTGGSR